MPIVMLLLLLLSQLSTVLCNVSGTSGNHSSHEQHEASSTMYYYDYEYGSGESTSVLEQHLTTTITVTPSQTSPYSTTSRAATMEGASASTRVEPQTTLAPGTTRSQPVSPSTSTALEFTTTTVIVSTTATSEASTSSRVDTSDVTTPLNTDSTTDADPVTTQYRVSTTTHTITSTSDDLIVSVLVTAVPSLVAVMILCVLCTLTCFCCCKRRRKKYRVKDNKRTKKNETESHWWSQDTTLDMDRYASLGHSMKELCTTGELSSSFLSDYPQTFKPSQPTLEASGRMEGQDQKDGRESKDQARIQTNDKQDVHDDFERTLSQAIPSTFKLVASQKHPPSSSGITHSVPVPPPSTSGSETSHNQRTLGHITCQSDKPVTTQVSNSPAPEKAQETSIVTLETLIQKIHAQKKVSLTSTEVQPTLDVTKCLQASSEMDLESGARMLKPSKETPIAAKEDSDNGKPAHRLQVQPTSELTKCLQVPSKMDLESRKKMLKPNSETPTSAKEDGDHNKSTRQQQASNKSLIEEVKKPPSLTVDKDKQKREVTTLSKVSEVKSKEGPSSKGLSVGTAGTGRADSSESQSSRHQPKLPKALPVSTDSTTAAKCLKSPSEVNESGETPNKDDLIKSRWVRRQQEKELVVLKQPQKSRDSDVYNKDPSGAQLSSSGKRSVPRRDEVKSDAGNNKQEEQLYSKLEGARAPNTSNDRAIAITAKKDKKVTRVAKEGKQSTPSKKIPVTAAERSSIRSTATKVGNTASTKLHPSKVASVSGKTENRQLKDWMSKRLLKLLHKRGTPHQENPTSTFTGVTGESVQTQKQNNGADSSNFENEEDPTLPERGYLEDIDFVANEFDMILRAKPNLPDRNYLEDIDFVSNEFDLFFRRKQTEAEDTFSDREDKDEKGSTFEDEASKSKMVPDDKKYQFKRGLPYEQHQLISAALSPESSASSYSATASTDVGKNSSEGHYQALLKTQDSQSTYDCVSYKPTSLLPKNELTEEHYEDQNDIPEKSTEASLTTGHYQPLLFSGQDKPSTYEGMCFNSAQEGDKSHPTGATGATNSSLYQPLMFEGVGLDDDHVYEPFKTVKCDPSERENLKHPSKQDWST